jgi:hypothetical protein
MRVVWQVDVDPLANRRWAEILHHVSRSWEALNEGHMEKIAKRLGWDVALSLALTSLLVVTVVPDATRASETPSACEAVSLAFLQNTVGLPHSALIRNHSNLEGTADLEPAELPQTIHTVCGVGLWSGSKPANRAGIFPKARSGQGALVGVDTWAPNDESPNVGEWEKDGFDELINGFLKGRFQFVHVSGQGKSLNPNGYGYNGAGLVVKGTGRAKGLIAAAGCWWDHQAHRAICLVDEEAEGKPVVDNLNAMAQKIVSNFLGAP